MSRQIRIFATIFCFIIVYGVCYQSYNYGFAYGRVSYHDEIFGGAIAILIPDKSHSLQEILDGVILPGTTIHLNSIEMRIDNPIRLPKTMSWTMVGKDSYLIMRNPDKPWFVLESEEKP